MAKKVEIGQKAAKDLRHWIRQWLIDETQSPEEREAEATAILWDVLHHLEGQ